MNESIEAQALREVETVPTNNITRIYRHAGKVLPEAIGGGCLWMAARLAKLLRARKPGIGVTYYDLGERGSHTTTVSDDGRERLLYEPSLFQIQPFSLTRFDADPAANTSDTYPLFDGKPMRMQYSRPGPNLLRMELLSPRGNPKRVYQFLFQSAVTINEDDPYDGLPFIEPQDQLYVHVLNPDFTKSVLMLNTRTKRINVGRVRDKLYVDTEPGFQSRFEKIAERLQLTEKELRDLLGGAVEIHNGHYPNL